MNKVLTLIAAMITSAALCHAQKVTVTVSNKLDFSRIDMAEVDMKTIESKLKTTQVIVTDADGHEITSQQTYDGKLIFQAGVGGKAKSIYYVKPGQPAKYEPLVFGKQYPERKDDFAWENDRVAFRCYGPALYKSGEQAWGYDIWNKRTSRLVVDDRYKLELDPTIADASRRLRSIGREDLATEIYYAVSYHVDHGTGMDCYKVGPTLGCGTPALITDEGNTIAYPHCYKEFKVLDNGPLRLTFELTFPTEKVDGMDITEKRIISLDGGSHLNRTTVTYEGLTQNLPIAVGIIVHDENPSAYIMNQKGKYMCYEDLGDSKQYKEPFRKELNKTFGQIYVGTVFTQPMSKMYFKEEKGLPSASGHILALTEKQNSLTYYFGSGWSNNVETGFDSFKAWEAYLNRFAQTANSPLKVSIK